MLAFCFLLCKPCGVGKLSRLRVAVVVCCKGYTSLGHTNSWMVSRPRPLVSRDVLTVSMLVLLVLVPVLGLMSGFTGDGLRSRDTRKIDHEGIVTLEDEFLCAQLALS